MGKRRKSAKKPAPKKTKGGLAIVFKCPMCSVDDACEVKMDYKAGTGVITCTHCGETHQAAVTSLSEPVDVFFAWVDALEELHEHEEDA